MEAIEGETLATEEMTLPPDSATLYRLLGSHDCMTAVVVMDSRHHAIADAIEKLEMDIDIIRLMSRIPDRSAPKDDELSEETVDCIVKNRRKQEPNNNPATELLKLLSAEFTKAREMAERAFAQMPNEDLAWRPDERGNSVSMLMRHLGGNLLSRFTDFLTTDGEKPDRDRDSEFRNDVTDEQAVLTKWCAGWECLDRTLSELGPADLHRTITIRGEPHTVLQALLRAVTHNSYHVGQIVDLARTRTAKWQTLSKLPPPEK